MAIITSRQRQAILGFGPAPCPVLPIPDDDTISDVDRAQLVGLFFGGGGSEELLPSHAVPGNDVTIRRAPS